jgi:hypothetical protein
MESLLFKEIKKIIEKPKNKPYLNIFDIQEILDQYLSQQLIDEQGEVYSLYGIQKDIKNYLIPFISAYNELKDSYSVIQGSFVDEDFLVETDDESIIYKSSLFNEEFDEALSTFDKRGNLVVKAGIEKENPIIF